MNDSRGLDPMTVSPLASHWNKEIHRPYTNTRARPEQLVVRTYSRKQYMKAATTKLVPMCSQKKNKQL